MKKVSNLIGTIALAFVALFTVNVHAEAQTVSDFSGLNSALNSDGTIELSTDITLDSTITVQSGKTITIDLKGHKITGPASGYGIENHGTLTIQDTGSEKGSIDCPNTNSSCIANKSDATSMTLNGVTVKGNLITVKNEQSKLVIKDSVIEVDSKARGSVGVESYGTTTIENTTIKTPNFLSGWGSVWVLSSGDQESKTTVNGLNVTGNGGLILVGDDKSQSNKTELVIEGEGIDLPKGITIYSYEGSKISPDAENVEDTFSNLSKSRTNTSIVVPEDYEGEVPNITGVKYINNAGTEVVYVTFNGVRYELQKNDTWGKSKNTNLKKALAAERDSEDNKNKTFVGFYYVDADGKEQEATKNTSWTSNNEVYIKWKITVSLNDVEYTLELGKNGAPTRIGNAVDANGNRLDTAMQDFDTDKYAAAHYYDASGKEYTSSTRVGENVAITKTSYVIHVKLNNSGSTISLIAGDKVSASNLLKEWAGKDHFYYFVDKDGNKYNLNSILNENVELTAIYSVTVKVAPQDGVSEGVGYKVEEGTTLGDILKETWGTGLQAYLDAEGFIKFVDEEGNVVELDTPITSDMNLTAIYSVVVRVAPQDGVSIGVGYRVEPGTTLRDILKETWGSGLQAYLDAKGFVKFVDANGNEVGLDTPITSDLDLVAVYKVVEVPENPNTFDGIATYVVMMFVSLITLVAGSFASKKSLN